MSRTYNHRHSNYRGTEEFAGASGGGVILIILITGIVTFFLYQQIEKLEQSRRHGNKKIEFPWNWILDLLSFDQDSDLATSSEQLLQTESQSSSTQSPKKAPVGSSENRAEQKKTPFSESFGWSVFRNPVPTAQANVFSTNVISQFIKRPVANNKDAQKASQSKNNDKHQSIPKGESSKEVKSAKKSEPETKLPGAFVAIDSSTSQGKSFHSYWSSIPEFDPSECHPLIGLPFRVIDTTWDFSVDAVAATISLGLLPIRVTRKSIGYVVRQSIGNGKSP